MDNIKFFEIVLSQVQDMMKARDIEIHDQSSLVKILQIAMECVELIRDQRLKGSDKKIIAIKVVRVLLDKSSLDQNKKTLLHSIIDGGLLETTIDMIIDASKGKFEFNRKTKRKLLACMGECLLTVSKRKGKDQNDSSSVKNKPSPVNMKIVKEAML